MIKTLLIIVTSALAAVICTLPESRGIFPISLASGGLNVADTMFHEVGHFLFFGLFGIPSVPAIFTVGGPAGCGGMTIALFERTLVMQLAAIAGLIYLSIQLWKCNSFFKIPFIAFTIAISCIAATDYHESLINYMGHGFSICMGGFFIFRAWLDMDARNQFERWLNGLFGFFLVFDNFFFSYQLVNSALFRHEYLNNGHVTHDFDNIAFDLNLAGVESVALFTMILCGLALVLSSFIALLYSDHQKMRGLL